MTRILAGVVAALVVALAALGWIHSYTSDQNALLKAANAELGQAVLDEAAGRDADRHAWQSRVKKEQALTRQKDVENAELRKALEQSEGWASQPVPCSVVAAIGLRSEHCPQ
jgi:hypothetical protein